ncbi:MAG: hypothetical protein FJ304_08500 [Planctomycetes bacterium]|nr:hypothetical protein [Planctomycetota bacterium]
MRLFQHSAGVQSVAYGPDGTLYALIARNCELWVYPAGGAKRVLAARRTADFRLEVSPDGRWLSVSGLSDAYLFRVGSLTPNGSPPDAGRCAQLPDWAEFRFPRLHFYDRTGFTGDSAFWFGRTHDSIVSHKDRFRYWSLPNLTEAEYKAFPVSDCQSMVAVPGTSSFVIEGWSSKHNAVAYWRGDLARPGVAVGEPVGTTEHCNGFVIGSDGRYFVTHDGAVMIYSVGKRGMRLDLTVPLPCYANTPNISLSADARRFVTQAFRSKLVCAVDTQTGEVFGPWDWGIGQVNDAAIAPDGLTACAGGSQKKLVVWDLDG